MSHFVVTRRAGPAWDEAHGLFEQVGVQQHAEFMNSLGAEGFLLLAGPLPGTEGDPLRVVAMVASSGEPDVRRRLADDPWERDGHIVTDTVESWNVLVGIERLA